MHTRQYSLDVTHTAQITQFRNKSSGIRIVQERNQERTKAIMLLQKTALATFRLSNGNEEDCSKAFVRIYSLMFLHYAAIDHMLQPPFLISDAAKPVIVTVDGGSYAPLLHSHVAVGTSRLI